MNLEIPLSDEDLFGDEGRVVEPTEQFVCFRLENEWFCLPVKDVRAIAQAESITPLPGAPAAVLGIMNLRGTILSVTDPKRILGLPPALPAGQNRIVVIHTGQAETGLLVDELAGILTIPVSRLEPLEAAAESGGRAAIEQTCHWEGRWMAILRADRLLAPSGFLQGGER